MEEKSTDMCRITSEVISPNQLSELFNDPACGAVVTFTGKVRNLNHGREVTALTYEAHASMAEKTLREIASEARQIFEANRVMVVHRVGDLSVGEVAVWIGVESAHREVAFSGCRYVIEEIKKRVPIWKKEKGVDGSDRWLKGCHEIT